MQSFKRVSSFQGMRVLENYLRRTIYENKFIYIGLAMIYGIFIFSVMTWKKWSTLAK
jgi:hypothetical protein